MWGIIYVCKSFNIVCLFILSIILFAIFRYIINFVSRRNSARRNSGYISSNEREEEAANIAAKLNAPLEALKRQPSKRRGKKKGEKTRKVDDKVNRRRLSFRGMIGQSITNDEPKDDIDDLANGDNCRARCDQSGAALDPPGGPGYRRVSR